MSEEQLITLHAAALVVGSQVTEIELELWEQCAYVHGPNLSTFVSYEDLNAAKELVSAWYEY